MKILILIFIKMMIIKNQNYQLINILNVYNVKCAYIYSLKLVCVECFINYKKIK